MKKLGVFASLAVMAAACIYEAVILIMLASVPVGPQPNGIGYGVVSLLLKLVGLGSGFVERFRYLSVVCGLLAWAFHVASLFHAGANHTIGDAVICSYSSIIYTVFSLLLATSGRPVTVRKTSIR